MGKEKGKFRKEFRAFALRGNVIDLAVGVIVGGAFSTITNSLVNDVIMPFVSMFLGGVNFSDWKITLPQLFGERAADAAPITLNYGNFIATIINFLILAFVVFMIVRTINRLHDIGKKKEAEPVAEPEPEPEPAPSKEECLLAEIRDLLKDKQI